VLKAENGIDNHDSMSAGVYEYYFRDGCKSYRSALSRGLEKRIEGIASDTQFGVSEASFFVTLRVVI